MKIKLLNKNESVNTQNSGFVCVPKNLMEAMATPGLTLLQIRCLAVIVQHTHGEHREEADLTLEQIGAVVGAGKGHVSTALKGLEEKGFIRRQKGREQGCGGEVIQFPSDRMNPPKSSESGNKKFPGTEKNTLKSSCCGNKKGGNGGEKVPSRGTTPIKDIKRTPPTPPTAAVAAVFSNQNQNQNLTEENVDDLDEVLSFDQEAVNRLMAVRSEQTAKAIRAAMEDMESTGIIFHAQRQFSFMQRISGFSDDRVQRNCVKFVRDKIAFKDGIKSLPNYLFGLISKDAAHGDIVKATTTAATNHYSNTPSGQKRTCDMTEEEMLESARQWRESRRAAYGRA